MSGQPGRSGRKPDTVVKALREAMAQAISPEKWRLMSRNSADDQDAVLR